MPEESHLDEMREAIRGDFERLAERRGEQELMRVEPTDAKAMTPGEVESEQTPRRSWLARLVSP